MNDEQLFRVILIIGFVVLAPIGIYHRAKAESGERLDRRQEGLPLLISIRVLGLLGMVGLVAYMIDPAWMAWSAMSIPVWMRWVGVGIGFLGSMLITWTFIFLGKNITDTVVTRKEHQLVTTGPYRWVRHPFYVSFTLAVLANSLVAANWFLLLVGAFVMILLAIRTSKEEHRLEERFGDEYRAYKQRTGAFFPRWTSR